MKAYETMSEAVNALVKRGYTHDFNLMNDCIISSDKSCKLSPKEFEIDEVHRFDGMTDPGDDNIVYAISSSVDDKKGILVNAYGAYQDGASSEMMAKLNVPHDS